AAALRAAGDAGLLDLADLRTLHLDGLRADARPGPPRGRDEANSERGPETTWRRRTAGRPQFDVLHRGSLLRLAGRREVVRVQAGAKSPALCRGGEFSYRA